MDTNKPEYVKCLTEGCNNIFIKKGLTVYCDSCIEARIKQQKKNEVKKYIGVDVDDTSIWSNFPIECKCPLCGKIHYISDSFYTGKLPARFYCLACKEDLKQIDTDAIMNGIDNEDSVRRNSKCQMSL